VSGGLGYRRGVSTTDPPAVDTGFRVHLEVFEGPFDLLLSLIAKRQLDVTLVALAQVTDEFLAHIRSRGEDWDLDQASGFLVVAATLLDLKVARLLPSADVDDEEDLALLEARDLLFARLLQYRAYKQIAAVLSERFAAEGRRYPRLVPMEPAFTALLPEVLLGVGPQEFAALAVRAMAPKAPPAVATDHLHAPQVSVREQAVLLAARLRETSVCTFRALTADAGSTLVVVARFLALLELYREGAVAFDQVTPLGELHVRWVPSTEEAGELARWAAETGETDDYDAPPPEEAS
jgi:segregation and condensation protein A